MPSSFGTVGYEVGYFPNGTIYHTALGAFEVHGAILSVYNNEDEQTSELGFPVSDEYDDPNNVHKRSDFEGGYIAYDDGVGGYRPFLYCSIESPIHGPIEVTNPFDNDGAHYGIDVYPKSSESWNVYAVADGSILEGKKNWTQADKDNQVPRWQNGNYVIILHKDVDWDVDGQNIDIYTKYLHFASVNPSLDLTPGASINKGTFLGVIGNTGYVIPSPGGDGTHLHFEVTEGTRSTANAVNPIKYFSFEDNQTPQPIC